MNQRVFLCRLLVALTRAGFSLADVQCDVLLPSRMHTTAFSIDQQLRRFVICLPMCHFFFLYACHDLVSHETASLSAECSRDKLPFSFVRGQDSTMWKIVWVSPQGHISVCKSPFPSAGTAVSLFRAKTVQQRPLLPREVETWLPDCGVTH